MFPSLCTTSLLICYISFVSAGSVAGYHYEKPTAALGLVSSPANLGHGHSFGPIPTIQPLPPVPALPPLPTPRPNTQLVQTQTLVQTHPVVTVKPTYLPSAGSSVGRIAQQYQSPGLQLPPPPPSAPQSTLAPIARSTPSGFGFTSRSSLGVDLGSNLPNPPPAPAQPLRVPFGKQAVISFPSGSANEAIYQANGRQLKQYAVVEIIDNDIEQNNQPFLSSPFVDTYRAHIGASGTGASPAPLGGGAIQFGSRSSASLLGQQNLGARGRADDSVALGSGGLGFIRLANGNVYLGSGSLGYVSGQQHSQEVNEARTRSGAPQPDALHFGHGPLGNPTKFNRFLYRFK